jgi:hypothetical protein
MFQFSRWLHRAKHILRILCYLASWATLVFVGYHVTYDSWVAYNREDVDSGTEGHATVDFGGQWYTGKLLLQGEGHFLYERHHQWMVLKQNFPPEKEPSSQVVVLEKRLLQWATKKVSSDRVAANLLGGYFFPIAMDNKVMAAIGLAEMDLEFAEEYQRYYKSYQERQQFAEDLMSYLLGRDDKKDQETRAACLAPLAFQDPLGAATLTAAGQQWGWTEPALENASQRRGGGQVYPPIHAFLYIPFALLDPVTSYRAAMIVPLVLALIAGWGLKKITAGALWWPLGTLLCVWIPGFDSAQCLGHNGSLIVALLVWGYYFLQKNAEIRGGLLWGLVAFKPSWAVTYFLMLVVSRRWTAALAMGACGLAQIMLTIPFVGVHSWEEWQVVLAEANNGYGEFFNWVRCSRDMLSMPRRLLNDFSKEFGTRDTFEARVIGFMLLGLVLEATVRLTSLRGRRAKRWSYAAGAFLLLGFWMTTYHITYYDTMFAALPLALLLFVPAPLWVPHFFRQRRLEWDGAGPVDAWKMSLPPGKFGLVCNPLIALLLPLIIINPVEIPLPPAFMAEWFWYWPQHVIFGTAMPDKIIPYWLQLPLIVPFFMMLWAWAGWMWLREREPVTGGSLRRRAKKAEVPAPVQSTAVCESPVDQLANSS